MSPILAIGIAIVTCILGAVFGYLYRKSYTEKKIDRTEEYARRLYDDAVRKAEDYKKERCWKPRKRS